MGAVCACMLHSGPQATSKSARRNIAIGILQTESCIQNLTNRILLEGERAVRGTANKCTVHGKWEGIQHIVSQPLQQSNAFSPLPAGRRVRFDGRGGCSPMGTAVQAAGAALRLQV